MQTVTTIQTHKRQIVLFGGFDARTKRLQSKKEVMATRLVITSNFLRTISAFF